MANRVKCLSLNNIKSICRSRAATMSDEGEDSDCGERGHLSSTSPSPPLSVCLPRESPSSARPLDLFSSASPLLGDTDPPYLASPECLHASPERLLAQLTPVKLQQQSAEEEEKSGSPLLLRRDVRLDALYDEPFPKWRGRGAATSEHRLQHRGQRLRRAPELPEQGNHYSADTIEPEYNSEPRQT